jgi:hypothetical protein
MRCAFLALLSPIILKIAAKGPQHTNAPTTEIIPMVKALLAPGKGCCSIFIKI